jgi:hypothetical protein
MKKLIITVTLLSFLNLIGCYYQEQMNPSKYSFDEEEDLQLTTKDTTYNIGEKDYYLENDTLFVTFSKKLDRETTLITDVELPIKDVETLEVQRTDSGLTALLILGSIIGLLTVLGAVYMSN